jgi:hypothetical protein
MSGLMKRTLCALITGMVLVSFPPLHATEISDLSPEEKSGLSALKNAAASAPTNTLSAPLSISTDIRITSERLAFGSPLEIDFKATSEGFLEGFVTVHRKALANPILLYEGLGNYASWGLAFWLFPGLNPHGFTAMAMSPVPHLRYLELKQNQSEGSSISERQILTALRESAGNRSYLGNVDLLDELLTKLGHGPTKIRNLVAEAAAFHGIELVEASGRSQKDLLAHYFKRVKEKYQHLLNVSLPHAESQLREMNKSWESLEKQGARNAAEAEPEKLNDLVKRNDRAGVARLLETFVPFELMEPVERRLWQEWVEAIRHPDASQSVILYRGIDPQDIPQKVLDAKGEVQGYGFFSTLLSKNQGNYTRRLRSLIRSRQTLGSLSRWTFNANAKPVSPLESPPGITTMMKNHAIDPVGSPFMSMTTELSIAQHFGRKGIVVARVDRRRLLINHAGIGVEKEILLPLILFPDEVLHFEQRKHVTIEPMLEVLESLKESTGLALKETSAPDLEMEFRKQGNFLKLIAPKDAAETCKAIFR